MNIVEELNKLKKELTTINYSSLCETLDKLLPNIPIQVIDFDNRPNAFKQEYANGINLLYRGRIIKNEKGIPYSEVEDVSYISNSKKDKIKRYGRVNKPKEAMFYCSTKMPIACVETFSKGENLDKLKREKNLMLNVSVWKIKEKLTLAKMTSPSKFFKEFADEIDLNLENVTFEDIKQENKQVKAQLSSKESKILEFFSEEFAQTHSKSHHSYKLSNYYADRVFNRRPKLDHGEIIDGIWFPSVPSSYQEINLVFPPEVVDEKLQFLWCNQVWVNFNSENKTIQFLPIKQRAKATEQGKIKW